MKKITALFLIMLLATTIISCSAFKTNSISVYCSDCGREFSVKNYEISHESSEISINAHALHSFADDMEYECSWQVGVGLFNVDAVCDVIYDNFDVETADRICDEIWEAGYINLEDTFPIDY